MLILKGLAIWTAASVMGSILFGYLVQAGMGSSKYDVEMGMLVSVHDGAATEMLPAAQ